jgi:small conductance mechanosensitive channel
VTAPQFWTTWAERGVRAGILIVLAWLATRIVRAVLRRLRHHAAKTMDKRGGASEIELEKRTVTITLVLAKVISTLIWLVAAVMVLNELTFNVQPLLAGLGVAGLAFGLGAQSLIKDWLGGFLLLIEDQIRVGDSVSINGVAGGVEEINLRTTVLRSENGAVHIIPNGAITQLSNFTREYSYYVFETTIAHSAPLGRALELLKQAGEEIAADAEFEPLLLGPLEVMGADKLVERGVAIRARIKTLPSKQVRVGRELNRRVKELFDRAGIEFPGGGGAIAV